MESIERNLVVFNALSAVYRDGAYSNIALNEQLNTVKSVQDKAYITRLFYGVLGKEVQLEYLIGKLTNKRPKPVIVIVLKMGLYQLRYMSQPPYAVIDTQVRLTGLIKKRELSGFVNAVLRKSDGIKLPIESKDKCFELSVNYSCPLWLVKRLCQDYGMEFTQEFLSAEINEKTHIRINDDIVSAKCAEEIIGGESSGVGYYIDYEKLKKLPPNAYAVQSKSSVLACHYYSKGVKKGERVLDLCSAPGGKAMFMARLGATVTACDLYPHRVNLIESYAKKQRLSVKTYVNDATVLNLDFIDGFDCVIADAPCSGIGVIHSKPDITFNRSEDEIEQLSNLQYQILSTASKYVKPGGQLNYSTCTIIKQENERVVEKFLSENPHYYLEKTKCDAVESDSDGFVRLYPQKDGCDGFFVAKLRRKND